MLSQYNDIMTTEEVAEVLRLNSRTILKFAKEGKIPAMRIANQYRYSKKKLIEWLEAGMEINLYAEINRNEPGKLKEDSDTESLVQYLISPENIHLDLASDTPNDAIKELVSVAEKNSLLKDPKKLLYSVLERERSQSTGVGKGFALPHPRVCDIGMIKQPFVIIGISKNGILFDTVNNVYANVIVLIVIPDLSLHLRTLSFFVRFFSVPDNVRRMEACRSAEEMIALLSSAKSDE
jgi:excisionase family DNA binding protein